MSALNLTDLNTTLGAYARDRGKDIYTRFRARFNSSPFTVLEGINDEHPLPRLRVANLIKKGNTGTFAPTASALGLSSRILKVRPAKVNVQIVPEPLYKTHIANLAGRTANDPWDVPFEQVLMNSIIDQAAHEVQKFALYKGVFGTGSDTAATVMDGLLTIVDAAIASGEIPQANVVSRVAITSSNAVDEVEKVKLKVPSEFLLNDMNDPNNQMVCILDKKVYDLYCMDYRTTFGALPYNAEFPKGRIDGTDIEFMPVTGLEDTNAIIITHKSNLYLGFDAQQKMSNINTQLFDYSIKVFIDWNMGINFAEGQEIWANGTVQS
jgi:hypothetical protein